MTSRKPRNKSGATTREQLLETACKVFAERGFGDATIAEICEQAGANIAAVNYYFGDKATLYVEAWREAFQQSVAAYPLDGGVPADAPPAQRLRGRVRSLMRRVHDPQNYEFRIVQKELANPTGLLDEAVRECIEPMRQGMADIVRELVGPDALEVQVMLCTRSIGSQCMHALMHGVGRFDGHKDGPLPECAVDVDVETITDHVVRFSLAGIHEIGGRGRPEESGEVETTR